MLPPPEYPGQEKSMPHEPDIVRHYRLRIRCHASLRRKNLLHIIRSCFLSGISGTGKIHTARTRYSPALPITDSMLCFPPKGKTCYIFVHAFFSGISGTGKKHAARTRYSPALPITDLRSCPFRKEKTPATYLLMLFSPEKTVQKKKRGDKHIN